MRVIRGANSASICARPLMVATDFANVFLVHGNHKMQSTIDFNALAERFAYAGQLPQLSSAALRLTQALDDGDAQASELERIILSDPGLTVGVIRAASNSFYGMQSKSVTSVRRAILVLGEKAVRSLAVSLWAHAMMTDRFVHPALAGKKFARHCLFVGYLAGYLYSREQKVDGVIEALAPEEVFAAGVLHDVGIGLLGVISPESLDIVVAHAEALNLEPAGAFRLLTDHSVHELAVLALETWRLPEIFSSLILAQEDPTLQPKYPVAAACLCYAEHLAAGNKHGILSTYHGELNPAAQELVGLNPDDVQDVIAVVSGDTDAFESVNRAA